MSQAFIGPLVEVLRTYAPHELASLEAEAGEPFATDEELGYAHVEPASPITKRRITLAIRALESIAHRIEPNLEALRQRLSRARDVRLYGGLAAALLSTGMLAAVLGGLQTIAVIAASLNFFATAATLYANRIEQSLLGDRESLVDVVRSVVGLRSQSEMLVDRLIVVRDEGEWEDAEALIAEATKVATELRYWERVIPSG